ncbi:trypsin-like serine peptidase [Bdellovibrio sp. HCB337]|uniref:trypsin-like serine peptidase n=1 Tax=Bdellovibrio sp. HCB337 TaxID=3394358 RepID=UPI0039A530F9
MKNTAIIITVFAAIIGTASVSFGDVKKCSGISRKNAFQKLPIQKKYFAVAETNAATVSIPNDPRKPLDRKQNPEYNAIGVVNTDLGRGSAWLGNKCLVWTAKHNLGRDQNVIGKKVKFSAGQSSSSNKDFEYTVDGEVVESGNPSGGTPDAGAEDWVLIKLNKSFSEDQVKPIKTAQYSVEDAGTCKTLEVAGYPGEKDVRTLWYQTNCGLRTSDSDITALTVGCPITPGNSGGPLLCRETDGSLRAIGIMNQYFVSATKGTAVNFTYDWREAKAAFQKHKDTCP